ncbi:MAG: hypothetical protein HGB37_03905 [Candidatus Moranbacteria bacterium]|nr:hypothetical protein [Candidatus Moranbacteria bacterium]
MTLRAPKLLFAGIMSAILLSSCVAKQEEVEARRTTSSTHVNIPSKWENRVTTFASMPIPWRHRTVGDSIIVQIYNLDKSADPRQILSQIQTDMRWNYRHRPIKETAGDIAFQNAVLKVHATLYSNGQFVETALY